MVNWANSHLFYRHEDVLELLEKSRAENIYIEQMLIRKFLKLLSKIWKIISILYLNMNTGRLHCAAE